MRGIPALAFIMLAAAFLPKARSKKTFKWGGGDYREVIHRQRARRASTATSLRSRGPRFGKGTPSGFVTRPDISFNLNPVVKGVKPAAWAAVEVGVAPNPASLRSIAAGIGTTIDRIAPLIFICQDAWQ
jgi:hypothetical protein